MAAAAGAGAGAGSQMGAAAGAAAGGLLSTIWESGSQAGLAATSANWGREAARRAFKRQQWNALNLPSLYVEGLRRAGLNPILAGGGGNFGAPSMSAAGMARAPTGAPGSGKGLSRDMAEWAKVMAEIAALDAQAQRDRATAAKTTEEKNILGPKGTLYDVLQKVIEKDLVPFIEKYTSGALSAEEAVESMWEHSVKKSPVGGWAGRRAEKKLEETGGEIRPFNPNEAIRKGYERAKKWWNKE